MATAKKKSSARSSAKPAMKYAAKKQASAMRSTAHTASNAANTAARTGAEWANKGASEWQKGASEWAKHSAKLYQMPSFNQGNAKDAAATVQSATENMMKMGTDMMQQMFGQASHTAHGAKKSNPAAEMFNPAAMANMFKSAAPAMKGFDASAAQEKMNNFARESAEQLSKTTSGASRALNEAMELSRENTQAAVEVTNVAVSVSKELGAEIMAYMNKLFSQNVEMSKQVLACRTLNDMFDLSNRIMKTNLDGFFSESVKVSEMIFQCATDVSEPLNERVSATTHRMTKAMAA